MPTVQLPEGVFGGTIHESKVIKKKDKVPYLVWRDKGWLFATPGNVVDYEHVKTQILVDAKRFRLQEVGFDKAAANTGVANEQPAEDEVLDEEITELDTNDGQDAMDEVTESTDEAAAMEDVAAGADESDADAGAEDDEQRLASEETTEGVDKADK